MLRPRLPYSLRTRARPAASFRDCFWAGALLVAGALLMAGCASASGPASPSGAKEEVAEPRDRDAYARRHFVRGLTHARLGKHAAAVRQYEKALRAAPEAPAILSALAEALAAQGDLSMALYQSRQARRFAEAGTPAARHYERQRARLLGRGGQPREALALYEALADSSTGATGAALLAEMLPLYRKVGDSAGVERVRARLARQAPQRRGLPARPDSSARPRAPSQEAAPARASGQQAALGQLVKRARALRSEQGAEAGGDPERLLRRALRQDSTHAGALALLGAVRLEAGAPAEAAALLARSLEHDPRAPKRWAQAARAHLEAGQAGRAAATAREGLLLFPGQVPLLRVRATALAQAGQRAEAARRLEEALRVLEADGRLQRPDGAAQAARLHEALARLNDRLGHAEEAVRHRRRARTLREQIGTAAN
jgi:tetratricopeptide (TPR) repeat protein